MWVRGLKLIVVVVTVGVEQSHPMWVRGLKLTALAAPSTGIMSHPMWVRGLKLAVVEVECDVVQVAPYVGAWIETPPICAA